MGEDCDVFCAGVLVYLWVGGEVEGEDIRFFFMSVCSINAGGGEIPPAAAAWSTRYIASRTPGWRRGPG